MADETQILKNRFKELASRSRNRGIYCYSDFLNLHEQTLLCNEIKYGFSLYGGFEDAERKIAVFGTADEMGYDSEPPVSLLCISPLSPKFSDDLTHRDFLGSLMGLGIKRETLGDIIITENKGYLFCLDSIREYIKDNLTSVRRTSVRCELCEALPDDALPKPKEKLVIVSSLRLDALISGVYDISRSKSAALIEGEKVFINGKLTPSTSKIIEAGDTVSVRGYGRFKFKEVSGNTKKGKNRVMCLVY